MSSRNVPVGTRNKHADGYWWEKTSLGWRRREPHRQGPMILCLCGCQTKIPISSFYRNRSFVIGHNLRVKPKAPEGHIIVDRLGYKRIKIPSHHRANRDGYVLEHIMILEKKLGRNLKPGEVTHHINGDRGDNHPENLEVYDRKEHLSMHHRLRKQCRSVK